MDNKWCYGCEELFNERYEECFTCGQFKECKVEVNTPIMNMAVVEVQKEVDEVVQEEVITEPIKEVKIIKPEISELRQEFIIKKPDSTKKCQNIIKERMTGKADSSCYHLARRVLAELLEENIIQWNGKTKSQIIWI